MRFKFLPPVVGLMLRRAAPVFFPGLLSLSVAAQSIPHRVAGLQIQPNGSARLEMEGRAASTQARYFDLFPVERSYDLVRWNPLQIVTRTNAAAQKPITIDEEASAQKQGFYRTPTNIMVSPLPPLTGRYAVGSFSRLLTDFSRTNVARHTNHQFMITVFYPANPAAGVLPEHYWERAMISSMQQWYGFVPNTNWYSRDYSNAPLAVAANPWPVLLYSPSLNSERRENLYKLLELASHGFIVAATDHRETFASAFPDGKIVSGTPTIEKSMSSVLTAIKDRVPDVQLMLGELTRMNTEEPLWAGRMDLDRVGAFGFSLGGSTAAELCRTDPRIRAGAGMDGAFFVPEILENPLAKPFLFLRADQPDIVLSDGRPDDRLPVIEKMTRDGYFIQLSGTVHWSFADYPLLTAEEDFQSKVGKPRNPSLTPTRINELSSQYLVSFFRKYLLDEDDHRLDSAGDVPEILKFVAR